SAASDARFQCRASTAYLAGGRSATPAPCTGLGHARPGSGWSSLSHVDSQRGSSAKKHYSGEVAHERPRLEVASSNTSACDLRNDSAASHVASLATSNARAASRSVPLFLRNLHDLIDAARARVLHHGFSGPEDLDTLDRGRVAET